MWLVKTDAPGLFDWLSRDWLSYLLISSKLKLHGIIKSNSCWIRVFSLESMINEWPGPTHEKEKLKSSRIYCTYSYPSQLFTRKRRDVQAWWTKQGPSIINNVQCSHNHIYKETSPNCIQYWAVKFNKWNMSCPWLTSDDSQSHDINHDKIRS